MWAVDAMLEGGEDISCVHVMSENNGAEMHSLTSAYLDFSLAISCLWPALIALWCHALC